MDVDRGFVVLIISIGVVLGPFLVFVNNGWPGRVSECTTTVPNTCFCEAYDLKAVQAHAPGVRQPVNTWSNLYALITSFIVSLVIFFDRRALGANPSPNLMKSMSYVPDLYIFCVLFLGLGSMWFHASLVQWGGVVDGASMYVFVAFLVFYSIRRFYASDKLFWIGYSITVLLFTYLHTVLPPFVNILILVGIYLVVEIYIWIRSKKILQGKVKTRSLWLTGLAAMIVASFFWWASQTGNFMCDPDSYFQPHGLLWHPLAGITAVLLYFYWREADDWAI
jgi:hypothetical protein